jgi:putative ATPase
MLMHCLILPAKLIFNALTKHMKNKGVGANYECGHGELEGVLRSKLPALVAGAANIYSPVDRGFEKDQRACLDHEAKLRKQRSDPD